MTSLSSVGFDPNHQRISIPNILSDSDPIDIDHLEIYNKFKSQLNLTNHSTNQLTNYSTNQLTNWLTKQYSISQPDLSLSRTNLVLLNNLPSDFFDKDIINDTFDLQLDTGSTLDMLEFFDDEFSHDSHIDVDFSQLTPIEPILSPPSPIDHQSPGDQQSLKLYVFNKLKDLIFNHRHRSHPESNEIDQSPVCLQIPIFTASGDINEYNSDENIDSHYKKLDILLFNPSQKLSNPNSKIKFSEMAEMLMYVNNSKININNDSSSNSFIQNSSSSPSSPRRSNSFLQKISNTLRRSLSKKSLISKNTIRPILKNKTNQNFDNEWNNTLQLDQVELDKFLTNFEIEESIKFEQEPQLTRFRYNQLKNYYETEGCY